MNRYVDCVLFVSDWVNESTRACAECVSQEQRVCRQAN